MIITIWQISNKIITELNEELIIACLIILLHNIFNIKINKLLLN